MITHSAGGMFRIDSSDQSSTHISQLPALFHGEVREGWIIEQPVSLKLDRDDDGTYIISEDVFNIYGQGVSIEAARENFVTALIEYYEILKSYSNCDAASQEALEKFSQLWLPPA